MPAIQTYFNRRRNVLFGGALATIFSGLYFKEGFKRMMKSEISAMNEVRAMLLDVNLRRKNLQDQPLLISDAIFRENMTEIVCENTEFNNCDFMEELTIAVKSFTNVKFLNCTFRESSISGGGWTNVIFDRCRGVGKFGIGAGEQSTNVSFNKCEFNGSKPSKDMHPEDGYGTAGSFGSASFVDCDMSYMKIIGPTGLSIRSSRLNQVDAIAQRKKGSLHLEKVDIKNYLDLSSGIFSSIHIKGSRFEYIDMESVEAGTITIEDCDGHFSGKLLTAQQMTVQKCNFGANGNPLDESERKSAGFNILYAKIRSLSFEDVKFFGSNGSLFLGGAVNLAFDKDEPKYGTPIGYSRYGKISIRNTSLKNGFFSYLKAEEISIKSCEIENADFIDSQIGTMEITESTFSGKTDFSNSIVKHFMQKSNIRKIDSTILSDTNKLVVF